MFNKLPLCPSCKGSTFSIGEPTAGVSGANFKMPFVICSTCNAAIAVMSYYDPGVASKKTQDSVDALTSIVKDIRQRVAGIENEVATISRKVK